MNRDRPDLAGTSRLSPHLHFGEVSPGEVWRAVMAGMRDNPKASESYLRQLVWREFAYHLLYHFPATAEQPLRSGVREISLAHAPKVVRCMEARPDRLPAGGRRYARVMAHRLDA